MAFLALVLHLLLLIAGVAGGRTNMPLQFLRQTSDDVGTRWAVLIAGTNGWGNYRHQADVCHAYQILRTGGLMDENIVVFMYDDIASNPANPQKGVIINSPTGVDVYAGVPKDYTGSNVNVKNFLAVLLGNKQAITGGSGKVVDSGPDDHIFVFFSGRGNGGVVDILSEYLYANVLVETLNTKHAVGTYKSLVFYLESSYSGSMFEGVLPADISVYATTASNATEGSYATYCGYPGYNTCLGDLYSVSWMEDSEVHDRATESLEVQYEIVKVRTAPRSHVMQYGDLSLSVEMLDVYMGDNPVNRRISSALSQNDADLLYLRNKYHESAEGSSGKSEARKQLMEELAHRSRVDSRVEMIIRRLFAGSEESPKVVNAVRAAGKPLVDDWDCLKSMVRSFEDKCGALGPYGMTHTRAFANMCNAGVGVEAMSKLASEVCSTGGRSF